MKNKRNSKYQGTNELFLIENNLQFYNFTINKLISNVLKNKNKILEFGAGIGTQAILYNTHNKIKPDCFEIDDFLLKILKDRNFKTYDSTKLITEKYDGIYSSNVLEHIEDDLAALKEINCLLKDRGLLVLFLPAHMCLMSDLDNIVGHYRRYNKNEIIGKLNKSNFIVIDCYFVDSLGFFASQALKFFGCKKNGGGLLSEKSLKFYDTYIFPISNLLDKLGLKRMVGKNLFVVAQKLNQSQ